MFLLPWTDLMTTFCATKTGLWVNRKYIVFYTGSIPTLQQFHSKESGERQECPLLGHCKVLGWPCALYVMCMCLIKKQQIELSTV